MLCQASTSSVSFTKLTRSKCTIFLACRYSMPCSNQEQCWRQLASRAVKQPVSRRTCRSVQPWDPKQSRALLGQHSQSKVPGAQPESHILKCTTNENEHRAVLPQQQPRPLQDTPAPAPCKTTKTEQNRAEQSRSAAPMAGQWRLMEASSGAAPSAG